MEQASAKWDNNRQLMIFLRTGFRKRQLRRACPKADDVGFSRGLSLLFCCGDTMATPISEYRHLVKPQRALVLLLSMALSSLRKSIILLPLFSGPIPITRDLIHFRFEFTQNFPQTPALITGDTGSVRSGVSTRRWRSWPAVWELRIYPGWSAR